MCSLHGDCRRNQSWAAATILSFLAACSGGVTSPGAPSGPTGPISVSGVITDRLSGERLGGSEIRFSGPANATTLATSDGAYSLSGLLVGEYVVTVTGSAHLPHETRRVAIGQNAVLGFSVLRLGQTRHGVVFDDRVAMFLHQLARVGFGTGSLRKWVVKPTEVHVVSNTVPAEQFDVVVAALRHLNESAIGSLWCNWVDSVPIIVSSVEPPAGDGRIVVRPNWDQGSSGTLGDGAIRSGRVTINVFNPARSRLRTLEEIEGGLLHELFHVAGAFHVCGGDLAENPFGFSPSNCSYPDSAMSNLGDTITSLSSHDRLASCVMYSEQTAVGNLYKDINPYYTGR